MSDALSLRWDEVDLPGKRVHARHLKAVPGGRTFPISKPVVALLQDQLAVKRNEFVFPGNGPGGRTMDLRAKTVPGTRHDLRRIFTATCLNVGLSDTVTKFLRGDAASSMLAKYSADVKLDHSTVELVAEHLRKGKITFKTTGYQEFTYSSD
jgi:integrase